MLTFKLFHWRSRVKTATPEVAGGAVETLPSHVSDENAHPDYLKKGAAVPTGQEKSLLAKHLADKLSHVWNTTRRDELLRTKQQYKVAKEHDLAQTINNFLAASGSMEPHIVTAYVLGLVLQDFVDKDTIKEMVKHPYQTAVGDGSQILYVAGSTDDEEDGFVHLSTKTIGAATASTFKPVYLNTGVITPAAATIGNGKNPIYMDAGTLKKSEAIEGTSIRPVYLANGVLTAIAHDVVLVETDQTIKGTKIFVNTPKISDTTPDPVYDVDLVNVGYLKKALQLPVNSIYSNTDMADPGETLGYGTWELIAELGNFGYAWKRVS